LKNPTGAAPWTFRQFFGEEYEHLSLTGTTPARAVILGHDAAREGALSWQPPKHWGGL
jgi:hypothetical protein